MVSSKPLNPEAQSWLPPRLPYQIYNQPPAAAASYQLIAAQVPFFYLNKQVPYVHRVLPSCWETFFYDTLSQPQPRIPRPQCLPRTTTATGGGGETAGKHTGANKRPPRGSSLGDRSRFCRYSRCGVWKPKNSKSDEVGARVHSSSPPPPPPSPPTPEDAAPLCGRTTVMIRNIPNQFRRNMLLAFLDDFCQKHNEGAKSESENQLRFEYDFVYLPMDFWRGDNLGYAFVNFTTAMAAARVRGLLHAHKWGVFTDSYGGARRSSKICELTWARIQGKEQLVNHFRNSSFVCSNSEYLPVVLSPPRDGTASLTAPTTIGRCLASAARKSSRK